MNSRGPLGHVMEISSHDGSVTEKDETNLYTDLVS